MQATINGGYKGGQIKIPPSKSMAHRALICAALAHGTSVVSGIITSDDMHATMRALRALGAKIEYNDKTCVAIVTGAPQSKTSVNFAKINSPVDCGESGSTLRFLIPILSLTNGPVSFVCHGKLASRPQNVYKNIFNRQGHVFNQSGNTIYIENAINSGEYIIDGSISSQFISGLLFTLPLLKQDSKIIITKPFESKSYVNLTIQAMSDFGVEVTWVDEYTICIKGNQYYKSCDYTVEGDSSQAAFWAVLAACSNVKGTKIQLTGLKHATLQGDDVIFNILKQCGAKIDDTRDIDGTLTVYESSDNLTCTIADIANCPDLGPILCILGLFCNGKTHITNAARLRIKESDRIFAMESEIKKLGGQICSDENNIYVTGTKMFTACKHLASHGDHRIVMALSVACLCAFNKNKQANFICTIENAQDINKSYPTFFEHLKSIGCNVTITT